MQKKKMSERNICHPPFRKKDSPPAARMLYSCTPTSAWIAVVLADSWNFSTSIDKLVAIVWEGSGFFFLSYKQTDREDQRDRTIDVFASSSAGHLRFCSCLQLLKWRFLPASRLSESAQRALSTDKYKLSHACLMLNLRYWFSDALTLLFILFTVFVVYVQLLLTG